MELSTKSISSISEAAEIEKDRINALSDYNLEYDNLQALNNLAFLAAKITGTDASRINLLDAYNQWTIAQQGVHQAHMDKQHSVCQYTIKENEDFEVKNLAADDRFNSQDYVISDHLIYYYGVPIKTAGGYHLGALCVMDSKTQELSEDQKKMLKIIGNEIVTHLDIIKQNQLLKDKIKLLLQAKNTVAHDIRGPISGIIGLADLVSEDLSPEELPEYMQMIKDSGKCVLDLATEILNTEDEEIQPTVSSNLINLFQLKEKTQKLFAPLIKNKGVSFEVNVSANTAAVFFPKNKLQQIIGNLVSNSIKFTPTGGKIELTLHLEIDKNEKLLTIIVADSGVGMEPEMVNNILYGNSESTFGTNGESGYGLGLGLVKQLVNEQGGQLTLSSEKNMGTTFKVSLTLR